jgi:hypothetical protein
MPLWLLPLVIALAVAACPVTMWVTSKLTRRKISCAIWGLSAASKDPSSVIDLEARKAEVDRAIAGLRKNSARGR